uniref:Secreted protein n=1 Tax=Myotis myotis TaxID=51298 RepID=A0A7J7Z5E3_MYOMY|nr:hypothetical protein mMyoMyo1_010795 [Myotis myotis]
MSPHVPASWLLRVVFISCLHKLLRPRGPAARRPPPREGDLPRGRLCFCCRWAGGSGAAGCSSEASKAGVSLRAGPRARAADWAAPTTEFIVSAPAREPERQAGSVGSFRVSSLACRHLSSPVLTGVPLCVCVCVCPDPSYKDTSHAGPPPAT